jgi:cytochrome c-type biogenesis protein
VLFAILALASSNGSAPDAAALLSVYALGLALPFLAVAVAFQRGMEAFRWLRDRYAILRAVSGGVLVALGLLVFFDRLWWLNVYVNRALSAAGLDGLPAV